MEREWIHIRKFLPAVLIIGFIMIFNISSVEAASSETAKKGHLTIRQSPSSEMIPLNGEWEFYFGKLYTPQDFIYQTSIEKPLFVTVPDTWNSYYVNGEHLPQVGYATYRLQVVFPIDEVGTDKAVYMPPISSAYKL